MKKFLKYMGITAAVVAGLLVAAFIVLKLISDDQYKEWITAGVRSATGRDFSIKTLELDLNSSLHVEAKGIRMANAAWSGTPDMLTVDRLEVEIDLISLFGAVAEIRTVIEKADIRLESNAEGANNWAMGSGEAEGDDSGKAPDADTGSTGLPLRPLIREFKIQDSTLTVAQGPGVFEKTASIKKWLIQTPNAETTLVLSASIDATPIELSGNLGPLDQVLDRMSSAIDIDGKIGDNVVDVSGTWGPLLPDPNLDLNLNIDVPSTLKLAKIAGIDLAELGALKFTAQLSAANGLFSADQILTKLDGDAALASIEGSIANLTALSGIDLTIDLTSGASADVLTQLIEQLNLDIPVALPPEVKVSAQLQGNLEAMAVKDFTAEIRDEGVLVTVAGTISHALGPQGIDGAFTAKADSTAVLSKYARLDLPNFGALDISGKIASAGKAVRLEELAANLDSDNINMRITGGVDDLVTTSGINAVVQTDISSLTEQNLAELDALLMQLKVDLPLDFLPKNIKFGAQVSGDLDQLEINDVDVEIRDDGVRVTLAGKITNALVPEGIEATIGLKSDSTAVLSKYAQMALPDLGTLDISGKIRSEDKTFSLKDLNAVLDGGNVNLKITGGLNDLLEMEGLDAGINLNISSITEQNITELKRLLAGLNMDAPLDLLPASASLSAKVSGGKDQLGVNDIDVKVRDEGILVALTGTVGNVLAPEGIDVTLTARSETLSALSKYARMDLPDAGVLDITGRVLSKDKTFSLENLEAKLDAEDFNVVLTASVGDLLEVQSINAELKASVDSLASLSEIAQTELPSSDPVTLQASVESGGAGENKPATVSARAQSAGATLTLDGQLSDLKSADNIEVSLTVEATSLSDFDKFSQSELPEKGPLKLTGVLRAQAKEFSLDDFQLTLDDQSLNGNVGIKLADNETELNVLNGELNIPYLDLSPFLITQPDEQSVTEAKDTETASTPSTKDVKEEQELVDEVEASEIEITDRLFSTDPLPLEQLRKFDADFSVTADRLKLGKTDMSDFSAVLSLKEGLLHINPIKGVAGAGTIDGDIKLDGRGDSAVLAVDITLNDMPMPRIGGELDFHAKLDGEGDSTAALMGGLDGQILIVMKDGRIEKSFLTGLGSGLFSFSGGKDYTILECGILRVDIKDGEADFENKLAAQLTTVNWRGGGKIDLKTEKLDAGIVPKPRKGLGIDVGAGNLTSLFHVGGTLKNPRVQLDPKDIALKYGKYMAYISTGGLSLLAEAVLNKSQANVDICAKILDGTVFDEDAGNAQASDPEDFSSQSKGNPDLQSASELQADVDKQAESGSIKTKKAAVDKAPANAEPEEKAPVPKNLQ